MPDFQEISPKQLNRLLGLPDAPALIDVRLAEDVETIPSRIPTARPQNHTDIPSWIDTYRDTSCVVICHKGLKLSHGTAAVLRSHGIQAEVLTGGMVDWHAAAYPAIPLDHCLNGATWVTRHRPKIDRIACPWLIRRFVDPAAQFIFVPPSEVLAVADRFDAIPFDVAGAAFDHVGDRCTFDALVSHFGLAHDALGVVADVVRAADTGRLSDVPQAAGLLAISVGLSRMYRDDQHQLESGMAIYDALYRWARDGITETHTHNGPAA